MGTYAKHDELGTIKVGVLSDSFFTRDTLLDMKNKGYSGEFLSMIDDSETLFPVYDYGHTDGAARPHLGPITLPNRPIHKWVRYSTPGIDALKELRFDHEYMCTQTLETSMQSLIIGHQYVHIGGMQHKFTVFACACCGGRFTISTRQAEGLKRIHSEIAEHIVGIDLPVALTPQEEDSVL